MLPLKAEVGMLIRPWVLSLGVCTELRKAEAVRESTSR